MHLTAPSRRSRSIGTGGRDPSEQVVMIVGMRTFISTCRDRSLNPLTLGFIRQRLGERAHFWPFDGWDIPVGRSAIAEVYPRLWSRGLAPENRTGDQHDAYSIAAWLRRADHDGSLAAFLKPVLTPSERAVAQVEGWILGVPGSVQEPVLDHAEMLPQTRH
jgi:hypothetical protein